MKRGLRTGSFAGTFGALVPVAVVCALWAVGPDGVPGFVGNFRATFGSLSAADHVLGAPLFALSGGVWGAIYRWAVRRYAVWVEWPRRPWSGSATPEGGAPLRQSSSTRSGLRRYGGLTAASSHHRNQRIVSDAGLGHDA